MYILNPKLNRLDAAKQFVQEHFEGREIGRWRGECFQLKDGVKWYRVEMIANGFDIYEFEGTPAA